MNELIYYPQMPGSPVASSACIRRIAAESENYKYIVIPLHDVLGIRTPNGGIRRMMSVAEATGAVAVYSDYYDISGGGHRYVATTECLAGSLRDDFDFGPVMLVDSGAMRKAVALMPDEYDYAGFYDLRLCLSRLGTFVRVPEPLTVFDRNEASAAGTAGSQFDYVDPRNRVVQMEMERVCTAHLKAVGAYLAPDSLVGADIDHGDFPVEASVVIPVRNRVSTIADAVGSALAQNTDFGFNVIVVDNHSDDGTSALLDDMAVADSRLIVLRPEREDLGIGGCWMTAVDDRRCGRFAVQLDSDDLYEGTDALARIVAEFRRSRCAMVVGSYRLTDFDRNTIPPGLIDHAEWTAENGHNNLLRVNGIGAPRAFLTAVLREVRIPDVSYGEDYAAGLAISRKYRIGRIYDSLYCCRRWDGNSDAHPSPEMVNRRNFYKDFLRTVEIKARQWR